MSRNTAATRAKKSGDRQSVRESFVNRFGEDQAQAIEQAALSHANGINDINKGSDPFKWAISIIIGYQCAEREDYRIHHKITARWPEIRDWIKQHADLGTHDGDSDYISLFAGVYNEYIESEACPRGVDSPLASNLTKTK